MDHAYFEGLEGLDQLEELEPGAPREEPSPGTSAWIHLAQAVEEISAHSEDFQNALATTIDVALRLTRAERGLLLLRGEEGKLQVALARDKDRRPLNEEALRYSQSIAETVYLSGDPLYLPHLHEHGAFGKSESVQELRLLSAMCAPIRVRDPYHVPAEGERRRFSAGPTEEVIGVLYVDSASAANPFSEKELWMFQALAQQAATVLRNARLMTEVTRDLVTNLPGRRYFEQRSKEVLRGARMTCAPCAILMLELDKPKGVKQELGPQAGDEVLRQFAKFLRACLRATDLCCRWGGKQYAVLLRETDARGAMVSAEKLRKSTAEHQFCGGNLRLTVSIGTSRCSDSQAGLAELIEQADQALFAAKRAGRNTTRLWTPEIGRTARRSDRLAGILTGDTATDHQNVSLLLEAVSSFNSAHRLETLLPLALDRIIALTDSDRGMLLLADKDEKLHVELARDRAGQTLSCDDMRYSHAFAEGVFRTGQACELTSPEEESELSRQAFEKMNLRRVLAAPLQVRSRRIGVAYVDSSLPPAEEEKEARSAAPGRQRAFFEALAGQAALAIETARLLAQRSEP